ncbi:hypothetical protein ACFO3K_18130 [Cellulomonas algicola]|uniref:DUF2238 domain-containing protein n=1 Tax=Cellulomonas algicola TaxID=2071633 RepID=A0A401V2B8_9CELL|nr:hypothetical protein [Cellulomonas algicola]GCD21060.1 hypothetical protein CTKZ_26220 [Cellulomonas algicola]
MTRDDHTARPPVRDLLRGPGGTVRVLALVSVVVALVTLGPVDAALLVLVVGGVALPPLGGVPPWLDAAYGVGLLASAWAGVLGLYEAVAWLDVVMHLVVTGLVAAVAHLLLAVRTGAVVDPRTARAEGRGAASVLVTAALGTTLSVAWEIGEYLGHTYLDPTIYVAYGDTIGDMVMGALGSTVAGAALVRIGGSAPARPAQPTGTAGST